MLGESMVLLCVSSGLYIVACVVLFIATRRQHRWEERFNDSIKTARELNLVPLCIPPPPVPSPWPSLLVILALVFSLLGLNLGETAPWYSDAIIGAAILLVFITRRTTTTFVGGATVQGEIGRELKVTELVPATVVVIKPPERNVLLTMWVEFVSSTIVIFFAGELKWRVVNRVLADGRIVDDRDREVHVFEYLGKV